VEVEIVEPPEKQREVVEPTGSGLVSLEPQETPA